MTTNDPAFEDAREACETAVEALVEAFGPPIVPVVIGALIVWSIENGAADLMLGTIDRMKPTIMDAAERYKAILQ